MNILSDEILNKYIDNELDQAASQMVRKQLESSEEDRKRFIALQIVHKELTKVKEFKLNNDFTSKLMKQIAKRSKAKKEQKIFIFSISSFFVTISLMIIGYIIYSIASAPSGTHGSDTIVENTLNVFQNFIDPIKNFLTGKNIAIIGSIFSFGLLLSVYFVIDTLKHMKHNISKSH